jgi:Cu/Zn superoxide dismutase
MRNSRFVVALVAVACAVALPAAAAAHTGKPAEKSHSAKKANHGWHKGKADHQGVRLAPTAGQAARGVADIKQRATALSVTLVVSKLTPGAFYAAHVHNGTCGMPGAVALTLPDVYADEHGVARLVTTVPIATGANYLTGAFSLDVHAGPTGPVATPVISCGDIAAKVVKPETSAAKAFLKGAGAERGHAELVQKGGDVSVWIKLSGLTPGAHALHLHAGSCDSLNAIAVSLGDVTAGPDGTVFTKVAALSSIPVVTDAYALDVHLGASAAPGATVACGGLHSVRWKHGHK